MRCVRGGILKILCAELINKVDRGVVKFFIRTRSKRISSNASVMLPRYFIIFIYK